MKIATIDAVNIVALGCIALIAYSAPFELFLFAYAVLGPLHYLTEISWLHGKSYFLRSAPRSVWMMVSGAIVLFVAALGTHGVFGVISAALIGGSFMSALVWYAISSMVWRFVGTGIAFTLAFLACFAPGMVLLFAVFFPTVVHVFFFTAAFMAHGALKSKSTAGWCAVVLFLILGATLLASGSLSATAPHTAYSRQSYASFERTNLSLLNLLPLEIRDVSHAIYDSSWGSAVMRFLAFAFTYHYVNWFSKTTVIRWHLISKRAWLVIVLMWSASVAIYAYDYRQGIVVLYFLSMLHVIMEFPLNHLTYKELGVEMYRRLFF